MQYDVPHDVSLPRRMQHDVLFPRHMQYAVQHDVNLPTTAIDVYLLFLETPKSITKDVDLGTLKKQPQSSF